MTIEKVVVGCCLVLALPCLAVPTPVPSVENLEAGEMSMRADIRFDALPSNGSALDFIPVTADAEGFVHVTLPKAPLAMIGDLKLKSREPVKAGESHQYVVVVSMLRHRVAFYLDGRLQFENDNVNIPEIGWGEPRANAAFDGEVRDLRVWDVELESERLVNSSVPGKSVWDVKAERNAAALAARVDRECAAFEKPAKTDARVAYQTDAISNERVMPDAIPAEANFSGDVDVIAAEGEWESASVVVMALKPVGEFTVKMSDLVCGDARIPAKDVDIRLVKRWYRTGGAWHTYFCDFRHRVLTPHLLVYDDDLIRVDEVKTRNYFRLSHPEGVRYVDVSDPKKGHQKFTAQVPFEDAKTLQPIRNLTAFGRNQQYWLTFRGPKQPGLYRGTLDLVAEGKTVAQMRVNFRVLPFELPFRPGSYDDPTRPFVNQLNLQSPLVEGRTDAERRASALALLKSCFAHNTFEIAGIWGGPKEIRELAREAGLPNDVIFDNAMCPPSWQKATGKRAWDITAEDRAREMLKAERNLRARYEDYARTYPKAEKWTLSYSEATAWKALNVQQQDMARICHKYGWNVFTHGGDENWVFAGDIQDGNFGNCTAGEADRWHAVGGKVASYATPMFASPENPAMHRRYLGIERWRTECMDGNMQHGLKDHDEGINAFAPDPGGDGNYRCQIMMYRTRAGFIESICWDGVREAYDDVRYGTLLKTIALRHREAKAEPLRREARRALMWLEQVDGVSTDMKLFRSGCAERILTLMELEKKGGK